MHAASVSPYAASLQRGVCYDPVSAKSILINFKVQIFISWLSRERLSSENDYSSSSFFLPSPLFPSESILIVCVRSSPAVFSPVAAPGLL